MRFILAVFMAVVPFTASAQVVQEQAKLVIHPTLSISDQWTITGWVISNQKADDHDNINFFGGMGTKGKNWSLETMVQRQLAPTGNHWALDLRYSQNLGQTTVFVELAPYLTRTLFYTFVIVEHPITSRLLVGAESENLHRPGSDGLGIGPRTSLVLFKRGKQRLVTSWSYQFRRGNPDWTRAYLVYHVGR